MLLVERSKNVIMKNVIIVLLVERSKNVIMKNVIIALLVERSKNVIIQKTQIHNIITSRITKCTQIANFYPSLNIH